MAAHVPQSSAADRFKPGAHPGIGMAWKGLLLVWLPCFPRWPATAPSPLLLVVCVLPLSAAGTGIPLHSTRHSFQTVCSTVMHLP